MPWPGRRTRWGRLFLCVHMTKTVEQRGTSERERRGGESSLLGLIHCHSWRRSGSRKLAWQCAQQNRCGAWVSGRHYCCVPCKLPCQKPFRLHMLSPGAAFLPSELPFQRACVGFCPAWGRQHLCPWGTCGLDRECCAMHQKCCCAVQVSLCSSFYTPTPAEGCMNV